MHNMSISPNKVNQRFFDTIVELPVTTYDIDFAGVVSNIVYVRWLEDMRLAMLEKHFPLQAQLLEGQVPAIVKLQIEYKRAIRLFEKPIGRAWISDLTSVRWIVNYEVTVEEKLAVLAEQTGIFVDLNRNNRPASIPEKLKDLYSAYCSQEGCV
jgi:acyl-CoA thioester hydrolase